ncbi:MAG: glycosyltransferase family 9 protein [Pseudomonadota bacterium]
MKFGALGDVIMSTALLDAIKRFHHGDEHFVITSPSYREIFSAFDCAVASFDRTQMWAIIRYLRSLRCDRIYDLQGNDRTSILCALASARERVGNHPRFPYTHHPASRWSGDSHIFERMCEILNTAGINDIPSRPVLTATGQTRARVAQWFGKHGLEGQRVVVFHAGASASRPEKCWPYFRELAGLCVEQGYTVVYVGGPEDAAINAELSSGCGIDATAEFSIAEVAELGRHVRFAVTNDSAPMHALSASTTPVFGIFGPSDWRRNHALGQRDQVIDAGTLLGRDVRAEVVDLAALDVATVHAFIERRLSNLRASE